MVISLSQIRDKYVYLGIAACFFLQLLFVYSKWHQWLTRGINSCSRFQKQYIKQQNGIVLSESCNKFISNRQQTVLLLFKIIGEIFDTGKQICKIKVKINFCYFHAPLYVTLKSESYNVTETMQQYSLYSRQKHLLLMYQKLYSDNFFRLLSLFDRVQEEN